jgi:hypothetical protein
VHERGHRIQEAYLVNVAENDVLHARMLQHISYNTSIPTADDEYLLRVRGTSKWDVAIIS